MRVHLLIFASIYLVLRFIYRNLQMTHCFLAPFISCVCGWICFFFCIIFDWIFVFRTYRETWIGGEMIKEMIWMFSKICHNVGSSHFLSSFFFYICLINAISLCFIRCHIYFWIYWWLLYKIPLYHCRKCFAIFICISSSSIVSINFMCLYFLNTQVFFFVNYIRKVR